MTDHYDLAGRASLAAGAGLDERSRGVVAAELDPFRAGQASGEPDVVLDALAAGGGALALAEVHNAAGDATVTATDGSALYLRAAGRWCRLPDLLSAGPLRFEVEPGFPLARTFGRAVRPALQLALLRRGFAAMHATAVELDGGGVVVAGWSESGKTETALALVEQGASFLTDKWTVVGSDGTLSAFPIGVGVRRWVLPYLPRLAAALPARSRIQLSAAAVADACSRPLRRRASGRLAGVAADTASRVVSLADRAALTPSVLRAVYGQDDDPARHVSARCVALLSTVEGDRVAVEEAERAWAAARLARSAAYERRPWFALQERARYAAPTRPVAEAAEAVVERERALLEEALSGARVLSVSAPFPVDPRRVADAIGGCLA